MNNETEELARLRKENDILRGLMPKLGVPCVYCGKTNMAECPQGFPGCPQADDLMVGEDETLKRLLNENRELKDFVSRVPPETEKMAAIIKRLTAPAIHENNQT